jgi:hypothetical protein
VFKKATTSNQQVAEAVGRGKAAVVLDVELIRAFRNACDQPTPTPPPQPPKFFTADEEKRLFDEVDRALRSWGK